MVFRLTKPGKFSSSSFSLCSSLFTKSMLPRHSLSSFICWDTENRTRSHDSQLLTSARASGGKYISSSLKRMVAVFYCSVGKKKTSLLRTKKSSSKTCACNTGHMHTLAEQCLEDILSFAWESLKISFTSLSQERWKTNPGLKTQSPQLAKQYKIFGKLLLLS